MSIKSTVIEIMNANADKDADAVCVLISKACGFPVSRAKAYYNDFVNKGLAAGKAKTGKRIIPKPEKTPETVEDDDVLDLRSPDTLTLDDLRTLL